jgi:hypothetical protein
MWRSIMEDDARTESGELFSTEAYAKVRGGAPYALVPQNLVAFDGREVRKFEAYWNQLRDKLKLKGEDRLNPISLHANSITESLQRLHTLRGKTGGSGLLILAAVALFGIVLMGKKQ